MKGFLSCGGLEPASHGMALFVTVCLACHFRCLKAASSNSAFRSSQDAEKVDQVLFLLFCELHIEASIEEFNHVAQVLC